MPESLTLSYSAANVLYAISKGHVYGYSIMQATQLPSGTVYPLLSRLERDELIISRWERHSMAEAEQRPPRKYYKVTRAGVAALKIAEEQHSLKGKLLPTKQVETV